MKPRRITYAEYERRVFNTILTECFVKMHAMANGLDEACCKMECFNSAVEDPRNMKEMAAKMAREFFKTEMNLDKCTINETKKKLCESITFVKQCVALAEACAKEKTEAAAEAKLDLTDDDTGEEVGEEEKTEIEKLFDDKTPTVAADAVAKASVQALMDEKKKSEEVKDAIDLAKAAGETTKVNEAVNRLSRRGPTSLMNAIMTFVSECAVRDVAEANPNATANIGNILKENAEDIRTRSAMMYSLFETMNAFGFKRYSEAELKDAAWNIYQGK